MADNVYLCQKCGSWFPTLEAKKTHICERVITREDEIISGKKFHYKDVDKAERREIGARLKELGEISKLSQINFMDIQELRDWVERVEAEQEM